MWTLEPCHPFYCDLSSVQYSSMATLGSGGFMAALSATRVEPHFPPRTLDLFTGTGERTLALAVRQSVTADVSLQRHDDIHTSSGFTATLR